MVEKISIKTDFGYISAYETNKKIFEIKFGKIKKQTKTKSKILDRFNKDLLKFFNRKISKITLPHKVEGSKIQKKIWKELKKIKIGKTKSYGEIANKYNISPREVGKICGQNKLLLLVPCHRVIRSDGSLGGFSSIGGVKLKKKLLQFEKVWKKV